MGRLIDETTLQETLALIPMEERTFRKAVETIEDSPTVDAIPRERIEQMEKDIDEMQAWGDNFGDIYLSYDKVKEIIHKYTKEQTDDRRMD